MMRTDTVDKPINVGELQAYTRKLHAWTFKPIRVATNLIKADFGSMGENSTANGLFEDVCQWQVADVGVVGTHVQRSNPLLKASGTRAERSEEKEIHIYDN